MILKFIRSLFLIHEYLSSACVPNNVPRSDGEERRSPSSYYLRPLNV